MLHPFPYNVSPCTDRQSYARRFAPALPETVYGMPKIEIKESTSEYNIIMIFLSFTHLPCLLHGLSLLSIPVFTESVSQAYHLFI